MLKRVSVLLSIVVVLAMLATQFGLAFATSPAAEEPVKELTIIFAQWDPANYLQQLCDEYTKESGVKIKVVQEPWASYGDRVFAEFAAKGTAYDMVVSDSQWMGAGATQGHYVELTDIYNTELNGKSFLPSLTTSYAEYPAGSGRYWSVPTEGDAMIWAYRKDLFEDPKEKEAFKAKYGYELGRTRDLGPVERHRRILHPAGQELLRPGHPGFQGLRLRDHGQRERALLLRRGLGRLQDEQSRGHR